MAQGTFRVGRHKEVKAILIHNNQITETAPLAPGQILNVNSEPCGGDDNPWTGGLTICPQVRSFSPELRDLVSTDAQSLPVMMGLAQQADGAGWQIGMDGPTAIGNGVIAIDSAIASGNHMLGQIQALGRKVVEEATAKFGKEVMLSRSPAKLQMVQQFLRNNVAYQQMQGLIATLPKQLKSGLGTHIAPTAGVQAADARWVRRLVQVEEKGAARFFRSAGSLLEGKISRLESFGKGTTFVLPAAIGLYNVARASPSERFRVAIEESVGIGMGAVGTEVGVLAGGALVTMIGLTGVGAFLLVFFVAGVAAYQFAERSKSGVHLLGEMLQ